MRVSGVCKGTTEPEMMYGTSCFYRVKCAAAVVLLSVATRYRPIAALELFSTLLGVMLVVVPLPACLSSTLVVSGVTDNQGNLALVTKAAMA